MPKYPKHCKEDNCKTKPIFGLAGNNPEYCKKHKSDDMIDVFNKKCNEPGCTLQKTYGIKGEKATHCKLHKLAVMVDLKHKYCIHEGCETRPCYSKPGEKKGKYCLLHKLPDMVDVTSNTCSSPGCNTISTYGLKNKRPSRCVLHKEPNMISVYRSRCKADGCDTTAAFGIKGSTLREYCASHKKNDMIDLNHPICAFTGCNRQPSFGLHLNKSTHCSIHKEPNMISKSLSCEFEGCNVKNRSYDKKGGPGRFCASHCQEGMINIKRLVCNSDGCDNTARFTMNKDIPASKCGLHKNTGMFERFKRICEAENCNKRTYYGKPGNKSSHCYDHREKGMIRRPTARCILCKIKTPAIWGINWIPRHCDLHKNEDDQNLLERNCKSCGLTYILDRNDKCESCNPESWATIRLAKQNALMNYLDSRGLNGESTDTIIDSGICGKERPDRIYDYGDKIIVLECDEHQHKHRACSCEQTRMVNIGQTFGGIPVYFIRWNPDDYQTENDKKQPENLERRHKLCGDLINDIKNRKIELPNALVSVIYLYYDEWSTLADEQWQVVSAYENNR
jgi:hypothetical protein